MQIGIALIVRQVHGQLVRLVLHHLPVRAPAERHKGHDDHGPAKDGGPAQGLARQDPVCYGDDEDGQQGGDGRQDGRGEGDEDEEAAAEDGVGQDGHEDEPAGGGFGDLEALNVEPVQEGEGDPKNSEGEEADARAEDVGEDGAADGGDALGGAGIALVEDLVEAVEDGADADDEIAGESGARREVFGPRRRGRGGGGGFVGGGAGVAVRDDEDAEDGDEDGDGLVRAEGLFEDGHGEGVGEEGAAVVYGSEVRGRREAHGNVPAQAGNGQRRGDVDGHAGEVYDGAAAAGDARGGDVDGLQLDHGDGREHDLQMLAPELRPRLGALLEAQREHRGGPEDDPRRVGEVHHAVGLGPAEVVLDVGRHFRLHAKGHEGHGQEEAGEEVLLAGGCLGGFHGGGGTARVHRRLPAERGGGWLHRHGRMEACRACRGVCHGGRES